MTRLAPLLIPLSVATIKYPRLGSIQGKGLVCLQFWRFQNTQLNYGKAHMVGAIPVLELLARQRHHTEGRESGVGASAINPKNLSLVPRFHVVEEENHLPKVVL